MAQTENIYKKEKGEYLQSNPTWHFEDSSWKAKQIKKILDRNSITAKTVVEVGCGAGEILNQLHSLMPESISYTGYDISIDAIELAKLRAKSRLEFIHEDFSKTKKQFDLLLMIDVFEHVDDYLGFLRLCKDKSNYKIFHIPLEMNVQAILRNLPMLSRKTVGHLHYFAKQTAIATLTDCGYEIVDCFYTASSSDLSRTLKAKIAAIPRKILFNLNQDLTVTVLGGYSLLVLAK